MLNEHTPDSLDIEESLLDSLRPVEAFSTWNPPLAPGHRMATEWPPNGDYLAWSPLVINNRNSFQFN